MNDHDPMCNAYDESRAICNCRFIAKVREDEREKITASGWKRLGPAYERGQQDERERIRIGLMEIWDGETGTAYGMNHAEKIAAMNAVIDGQSNT